jgi:hypothetical protein
MKCLETRQRNGIKTRRYLTDDGRRFSTYELPVSVLRGIGMKRVHQELERWQRGETLRARLVQIKKRVAEGVKPLAIADEFGVTETRVRQIRKEMGLGRA